MLECLREMLAEQGTEFAYMFNSRVTADQFLEMIAYELALRCNAKSKVEILNALNEFLITQASRGKTTVLIVDEAHNLDPDVLEEVRMLGNLENAKIGKLLQIILSGQPELDGKLDDPKLRQLKQRIVLRCALKPLSEQQVSEYLNTRLAKAGMPNQKVFPPALITEIHIRTQGIPRIINAVCDNLLLTCFAMEEKLCTMEMLDEVVADMRLEWPTAHSKLGRTLAGFEPAEVFRRNR